MTDFCIFGTKVASLADCLAVIDQVRQRQQVLSFGSHHLWKIWRRCMSRFSRFLPTLVVLYCLAVANAFAQQGSAVTGSLTGSVTDSSGALVSGADITVIGPQGQRTAKSDALGRYAIDNLIPGFYD